MWENFRFGLRLLGKQPFTLAAIVWLPSFLAALTHVIPWGDENLFEPKDNLVIFVELVLSYGPIEVFADLAALVLWPISLGAFIHAIDALTRDDRESVISAYRAAFVKAHRLIWNYLVVMILTAFATVLFIIPGIYVYIKYSLVSYTIMLENRGPGLGGPRARSWDLISGYEWPIFFCGALTTGLAYAFYTLYAPFLFMGGMDIVPSGMMVFAMSFTAVLYLPLYAFVYACFAETVFDTDYTPNDEEPNAEGPVG